MSKPNKINAAVFDGDSRSISLRSVDWMDVDQGEVLVKVSCCTICGSDLHTYQGHRSSSKESVLGHEIVGKVVRFGGQSVKDFNAQEIEAGDRVTWSLAVGCGSCYFCKNDIPQKCESLFKFGHQEFSSLKLPTGGLSEYCLLPPGTPIFKVPDSLPDSLVAPANCATATVAGALRVAGELKGKVVAIVGLGMLGLTASAMAKEARAATVIALDTDPDRCQLSEQFGANHSIVAGNDTDQKLKDLTDRRGPCVALEFSGSNSGVRVCIDSIRIGGKVVLVGSVSPSDGISIVPEDIVRRMITITGLHNYQPKDLAVALRFLESCRWKYPFESLVEREFSLNQAEEAFEYAISQRPVRVAVVPGSSC